MSHQLTFISLDNYFASFQRFATSIKHRQQATVERTVYNGCERTGISNNASKRRPEAALVLVPFAGGANVVKKRAVNPLGSPERSELT